MLTYQEATDLGRQNPGSTVTRNPEGGFLVRLNNGSVLTAHPSLFPETSAAQPPKGLEEMQRANKKLESTLEKRQKELASVRANLLLTEKRIERTSAANVKRKEKLKEVEKELASEKRRCAGLKEKLEKSDAQLEQYKYKADFLEKKMATVSPLEWKRIADEETERVQAEFIERRPEIISLAREGNLSYSQLRQVLDQADNFHFSADELSELRKIFGRLVEKKAASEDEVSDDLAVALDSQIQHKKSTSSVDLVVLAANLGNSIRTASEAAADPLVAKAIEMTSNRPLEELASNPESFSAALNAAKGKYFELLVEEKLNTGEAVGDFVLREGGRAQLATSMTQPGWDVAILDSSSHVVDELQLKATDSIGYIRDTLERYPDIKILSTEEAAALSDQHRLVLDSGISNVDIEHVVGHAIAGNGVDFLTSFLDTFNPLFPLVVILATEGYKVAVGKQCVEQAVDTALDRAKHSLTGGAVGALFFALGFGWVSIVPAVLAAAAGPEKTVQLIEGAFDGVVAWYIRGSQNAVERLPEDYIRWANTLNHMAAREGIVAMFTPEYVASHMNPTCTGLGLVNGFANGWDLAKLYSAHPDVKAAKDAKYKAAVKGLLEQFDRENPLPS